MKKAALFTSLATAASIAFAASAGAQDTQNLNADGCIHNLIDEFFVNAASIQEIPGLRLTIKGDLQDAVSFCEEQTRTEAETFKGMNQYRETRGNVIFELN